MTTMNKSCRACKSRDKRDTVKFKKSWKSTCKNIEEQGKLIDRMDRDFERQLKEFKNGKHNSV